MDGRKYMALPLPNLALNNAPSDVLESRMVTVTKGMRILGHRLHELWNRFNLDRPLINMIIRFLDLPVRVFRQLELNPRYDPRQPGGITRQINEFPIASHYYREGYYRPPRANSQPR